MAVGPVLSSRKFSTVPFSMDGFVEEYGGRGWEEPLGGGGGDEGGDEMDGRAGLRGITVQVMNE